jgi:agmatine deiminase
MSARPTTPLDHGFRMPAEWDPHAGTIMIWPVRSRSFWGDDYDAVCAEYAGVARAIAAFEPVFMVCRPGEAQLVRNVCGSGVEPLEFGADDSWARDAGPIFVTDDRGDAAVVKFGFNAWGNRWHPYDQDALIPDRIAAHFGLPLFSAPMILEGGSFFVDGEGTLLTTEQCLLNPNRNPTLDRAAIEGILHRYLGVTTVLWMPFGHSLDTGPVGTDGHVDGVAQWIGPGRILLELPESEHSSEYHRARANLAALRGRTDAAGREVTIEPFDPPLEADVSYANHYLANGAVIVPVDGGPGVHASLAALQAMYPDRDVVGVDAAVIASGGGGPHCITQQIPAGAI